MEFKIPCRNAATGEKREFDDLQQVADFLETQEHPGDWVGFEPFGQLPEPAKAAALKKALASPEAKAGAAAIPTLKSQEPAKAGLVEKVTAAAKKVVGKKR